MEVMGLKKGFFLTYDTPPQLSVSFPISQTSTGDLVNGQLVYGPINKELNNDIIPKLPFVASSSSTTPLLTGGAMPSVDDMNDSGISYVDENFKREELLQSFDFIVTSDTMLKLTGINKNVKFLTMGKYTVNVYPKLKPHPEKPSMDNLSRVDTLFSIKKTPNKDEELDDNDIITFVLSGIDFQNIIQNAENESIKYTKELLAEEEKNRTITIDMGQITFERTQSGGASSEKSSLLTSIKTRLRDLSEGINDILDLIPKEIFYNFYKKIFDDDINLTKKFYANVKSNKKTTIYELSNKLLVTILKHYIELLHNNFSIIKNVNDELLIAQEDSLDNESYLLYYNLAMFLHDGMLYIPYISPEYVIYAKQEWYKVNNRTIFTVTDEEKSKLVKQREINNKIDNEEHIKRSGKALLDFNKTLSSRMFGSIMNGNLQMNFYEFQSLHKKLDDNLTELKRIELPSLNELSITQSDSTTAGSETLPPSPSFSFSSSSSSASTTSPLPREAVEKIMEKIMDKPKDDSIYFDMSNDMELIVPIDSYSISNSKSKKSVSKNN